MLCEGAQIFVNQHPHPSYAKGHTAVGSSSEFLLRRKLESARATKINKEQQRADELSLAMGTNNKSKVQNNEECSTKSLNPQEKRTAQIYPKASNASNSTLPDSALIQGLKWVAIERAKIGEFNATKIIKNRGWKQRESAMESYGEQ
ncbi:hypothetical protein F511_36785 [Dorcoceras hygrometricum]|uniref:Uncharacterized protein n=1 Tax=Dorcoceras hygrometricum TaxID=472368 RepID=A0A2Z7D024_9LAMI|nr:hypothetical protein F511_36785 [Dorcoceras hygrometricum]